MDKSICEILKIKYPIIQGGMAWVSNANLAAAVSNAGGLGVIAAGNAPADVVRDEIRKAKELTKNPFGVNIMLLSPFVDEIAQLVIDEDVKIITTGAGNPLKYVKAWKDKGIIILSVVASVAHAKKIANFGADVLIAEGMEAGGHIGKLTTMTLVPQIVDQVNIPVVAAGGIGDGRGMAAAFMLGAKGVQIGTRFLVAKECTISENYKKMVLKAKDIDTIITGQITGHPIRALKNKFTKTLEQMEKNEISIEEFEKFGTGSLKLAVVDGDIEKGSFMCGQIAGLIKKEQTCKEIIEELDYEYKNLILKFNLN